MAILMKGEILLYDIVMRAGSNVKISLELLTASFLLHTNTPQHIGYCSKAKEMIKRIRLIDRLSGSW